MLSLIALALLRHAPVQEPPRLRTILPNKAVVLVEHVSNEPSIILSLWLSAASYPETPIRNGVRHLMEHFLAKGSNGDVDARLEGAGGFLRAQTYRDAMNLQVTIPKTRLSIGVEALRSAMSLRSVSPEEIAREAAIVRLEGGIREPASFASNAAWSELYGDKVPDPFGSLDVISSTSPSTLAEAHRQTFVGPGTALVVVGDVDLDGATRIASSLVVLLPGEASGTREEPRPVAVKRIAREEGWRAVPVNGFREPSTAAALMAGLAIASELDEAYFLYTPSALPGAMIVGGKGFSEVTRNGLFNVGRRLAERWVRSQLETPEGIAYLRGILLCQGSGLRPETLLENIKAVSPSAFEGAMGAFGVDR